MQKIRQACSRHCQSESNSAAPFLGDPLVQAAVEAVVVHVVLILQVDVIVAGLNDFGRLCAKDKDIPHKKSLQPATTT
ncbi:hypothetical protein E2C01_035158 [Portunus trituberculatus]|uniref:Uncharacterized protein n=1 Tax=Portunus trituberculatus TaxID=210409 RepID=A0A5B7F8Z1_PORTR|nr:hypothetical protein [Portunus trituberculatus]